MRDRGFEDAFIATYKDGKRVGLSNVLSRKIKLRKSQLRNRSQSKKVKYRLTK